jgi:acyl-CoA thioesterase FadM
MLPVTHTSSVSADQIDHLGHMNVRYYGINAHAGTEAVLAGIDGWPAGRHLVHDAYTRHHREQLVGTQLLVRSAVLGADPAGVRIHHELVPANAEAFAATFVHRVSPLDEAGAVRPVPQAALEAARSQAVEPPPYAAPRTVDLTIDLLAAPPSIDVVQQRDLAVRKPRTIGAEETDERGEYRPEATMMLLWAGELPDHVEGWGPALHEGPDGELMGWAMMETRVQLARLPRLGTRIQSFGATIAVHERATHRIHWCYDLDSGEPLCAFEAVDVAFDTRSRRSMVIPASFRRQHESSLHPDLAPAKPAADARPE